MGMSQQPHVKSGVVRYDGTISNESRVLIGHLGPTWRGGHHVVSDAVNRGRLSRDWPGWTYQRIEDRLAGRVEDRYLAYLSVIPNAYGFGVKGQAGAANQLLGLRSDRLASKLGRARFPTPRHTLGRVVDVIGPMTLPEAASGPGGGP